MTKDMVHRQLTKVYLFDMFNGLFLKLPTVVVVMVGGREGECWGEGVVSRKVEGLSAGRWRG